MIRTNDNLKKAFEAVAEDYLNAFLEMYELDAQNGWWVADEIGGLYINGDLYYVTFDEMRYIVDNDIPEETYIKWYDYCDNCVFFGIKPPTLKAWCDGCPRISDDDWDHLASLRTRLDNEVEQLKESVEPYAETKDKRKEKSENPY